MVGLASTTVVRDPAGESVVLLAGNPVPDWALAQIGEHLLEDASGAPTGPSSAWTVKQLSEYAAKMGVDTTGVTKKDALIALITEAE